MVPNCATSFVPLRDAIDYSYFVLGPVSKLEILNFDLPTQDGGLGISNSVESASATSSIPVYS